VSGPTSLGVLTEDELAAIRKQVGLGPGHYGFNVDQVGRLLSALDREVRARVEISAALVEKVEEISRLRGDVERAAERAGGWMVRVEKQGLQLRAKDEEIERLGALADEAERRADGYGAACAESEARVRALQIELAPHVVDRVSDDDGGESWACSLCTSRWPVENGTEGHEVGCLLGGGQ
jgi:hypothetical protein